MLRSVLLLLQQSQLGQTTALETGVQDLINELNAVIHQSIPGCDSNPTLVYSSGTQFLQIS